MRRLGGKNIREYYKLFSYNSVHYVEPNVLNWRRGVSGGIADFRTRFFFSVRPIRKCRATSQTVTYECLVIIHRERLVKVSKNIGFPIRIRVRFSRKGFAVRIRTWARLKNR